MEFVNSYQVQLNPSCIRVHSLLFPFVSIKLRRYGKPSACIAAQSPS